MRRRLLVRGRGERGRQRLSPSVRARRDGNRADIESQPRRGAALRGALEHAQTVLGRRVGRAAAARAVDATLDLKAMRVQRRRERRNVGRVIAHLVEVGVLEELDVMAEIGANFVGGFALGGRDLEHLEKKIHDLVRDPGGVAGAHDLGALGEVVFEVRRVRLHLDVLRSRGEGFEGRGL